MDSSKPASATSTTITSLWAASQRALSGCAASAGLVWSAPAEAVEGWVYQGLADTCLLDAAMRDRMAALNPHATATIAGRLLEANNRGFWDADPSTLEQLKEIYADLEDRLEGVR